MTKKHFKLLAEVIKKASEDDWNMEHFAIELCPILRSQNPNFQSGKFLAACGFKGY